MHAILVPPLMVLVVVLLFVAAVVVVVVELAPLLPLLEPMWLSTEFHALVAPIGLFVVA